MGKITQSFSTHQPPEDGLRPQSHNITSPFFLDRFQPISVRLLQSTKVAGFELRHIFFTSISKRSQIAERKEWIQTKIVKVSRLLRDAEAVGLNPLSASCSLPDYFCLLWP